ncbi:hypothetical protein CES85_4887 [Ochrobactrum quorumnocens]|uniref:Uncharacterized protein n=1 Tax=Ochrobactrum quorumnocens TaxID=271865 RepID=A0A248UBI9_9HYPH|nr:hypothetical protein CES85_4887 [[Ochrobactrum] quorumnocens]
MRLQKQLQFATAWHFSFAESRSAKPHHDHLNLRFGIISS